MQLRAFQSEKMAARVFVSFVLKTTFPLKKNLPQSLTEVAKVVFTTKKEFRYNPPPQQNRQGRFSFLYYIVSSVLHPAELAEKARLYIWLFLQAPRE
jgi:hypothetical protein